jgi:uncharacterized protein (DUF58 family)
MWWFLAVVLILLAALALDAGLLAFAMYVLLGVLIVSRLLARTWIGKLSAVRTCPTSVAEIGDKVDVTVTIRNGSSLPVPWVLLEDMLPRDAINLRSPRLKIKGRRVHLRMIRGRGTATLEYQLTCVTRGYFQIGPLLMESGDLFGLHRRYRIEAEPHYLLVYPKVVPLAGYDLASRRPIGDVRLTHRLFEDPTRIGGVRPYEAGDPLNRVHWRATARTGALHSKVYEPSSLAGATLVLDFHKTAYPSRGEPSRSELAVTAAASLAHAVFQMGQQVGLISNGRDAADRIRLEGWDREYRTRISARTEAAMVEQSERLQPIVVETRRGPEQFQKIHEALARVELTDGLTLAALVLETAGRMPRDATVVALLADVEIETALALGNLKRRGFAVTVVLIAMDERAVERGYGRLVSEGIRDVRHLANEAGIPELCRQQALGPSLGQWVPTEPKDEERPTWAKGRAYRFDSSEDS